MRDTETDFEFLDRSARVGVHRVRELITKALTWYPADEAKQLVQRIRSSDGHGFRSAAFELLIHEVLRRRGFDLRPHPQLPNQRRSRPDFFVTSPEGQTFYLEMVLASTDDGSSRGANSIKAHVLDALSSRPHL